MTSEARVIDVPGVPRFEIAPHHCFACGTLNEHGMHLEIHVEPGRAWTDLVLEPRFQGWDGIAHGGILCTILDEVMAWSLVGEDNWGLTARMELAFKRPVPLGASLHAEGRVTRARRRLVQATGRILDRDDGTVYVTASATYVAADEARKQELRERYRFAPRSPSAIDTPVPVDGVHG